MFPMSVSELILTASIRLTCVGITLEAAIASACLTHLVVWDVLREITSSPLEERRGKNRQKSRPQRDPFETTEGQTTALDRI